jgi:transposase-like protein
MNKFNQKYSDELRNRIKEQVLNGEPVSKISDAYKIPVGFK